MEIVFFKVLVGHNLGYIDSNQPTLPARQNLGAVEKLRMAIAYYLSTAADSAVSDNVELATFSFYL